MGYAVQVFFILTSSFCRKLRKGAGRLSVILQPKATTSSPLKKISNFLNCSPITTPPKHMVNPEGVQQETCCLFCVNPKEGKKGRECRHHIVLYAAEEKRGSYFNAIKFNSLNFLWWIWRPLVFHNLLMQGGSLFPSSCELEICDGVLTHRSLRGLPYFGLTFTKLVATGQTVGTGMLPSWRTNSVI